MLDLGWSRRPWVWAAVAPFGVWALIRTVGADGGFPIIPLLAYTPYVCLLSLLAVALAAGLRNWAATSVAALAAVLLLVAVLPRAFGEGESIPDGDRELRVLSANVGFGGSEPEPLLELAQERDVDLLAIQELTPGFSRELEVVGVARLFPYAILNYKQKASGGGLYSRYPLRRLPSPPPRPFRMPRVVLALDSEHQVRIVDVHPFPPKVSHVGLWREGLASLPSAESTGRPWLLLGDFNATLDFPALRDLIDSGYRDAADSTGSGLEPTWPQGKLLPPPVTIDHVLADQRLAIAGYAVEDQPGSDHRAVYARLGVPPLSR